MYGVLRTAECWQQSPDDPGPKATVEEMIKVMDFLLHFGPSHYNDLFRCDEPFFSKRGKGNINEFINKYLDTLSKAGSEGLICFPSGNHDMARLSKWLDPEEIKIAFSFILTMPGAPFIYYGDEIGMRYLEDIPSKEGGYERTGARTPMQWDASTNCGFSSASADMLYLCQDPSEDRPTVASQLASDASIINEVKRLTSLRHSHPALQSFGTVEFINVGYPLVYRRSAEGENIVVIVNPSDKPQTFDAINGEVIYSLNCKVANSGTFTDIPAQATIIVKW